MSVFDCNCRNGVVVIFALSESESKPEFPLLVPQTGEISSTQQPEDRVLYSNNNDSKRINDAIKK